MHEELQDIVNQINRKHQHTDIIGIFLNVFLQQKGVR